MAIEDVKQLLMKAAAKSNDSSEEKYVTAFLFDILTDEDYEDEEDRMNLVRASAQQMLDFCELVVREANK